VKIGLCVFSANIEKAAKAGYDYIQLPGFEVAKMNDAEFEKTAETVKNCGIPVLGFNAFCTGELPIASDGFDEAKTVDYVRLLLKRGKALGVRNFGIGAPLARRLPAGFDMKKAWENGKSFMLAAAREALPYGVNVLVEPLNNKCCDFITTLPEGKKMADEIAMENVGMIVDFYHMTVNGEKYETAAEYIPFAKDVHISGCGEKYERPFVGEKDRASLESIAAILKKAGYDKTLSLEPDNISDGFEEKAAESLKLLRELF